MNKSLQTSTKKPKEKKMQEHLSKQHGGNKERNAKQSHCGANHREGSVIDVCSVIKDVRRSRASPFYSFIKCVLCKLSSVLELRGEAPLQMGGLITAHQVTGTRCVSGKPVESLNRLGLVCSYIRQRTWI